VLGAFAGVASAQSSVTLNGTLDMNLRSIDNGSAATYRSMGTDGINSSQLVFRGIEDLGGGLQAGFVLNSGVNPDTGTSNAKFWNRRATASLIGGFGEVRLGRDYTPTFWNQTLFDPFGTNGIGTMASVYGNSNLGTNSQTLVRADNSVAYFLPSALGAINGHLMVSPNEGGAGGATGNKYVGARFGFNAGPIAAGLSFSQTTVAKVGAEDKLKLFNIAGSYDFGVAKPDIVISQSKFGNIKTTAVQLGVIAPMGQGELRAAYNKVNNSGGAVGSGFGEADDFTHYALGYVYNLSKRTALYGTVARISNKGAQAQVLAPAGAGMKAGENSTGYEFGLRHFF
jgi:predicted porin